jgi:hypothetical protein
VPNLRLSYGTGDTDEWGLTEQADLTRLARRSGERKAVVFAVATEAGHEATGYGFISLRMAEVVMWQIDCYLDEELRQAFGRRTHPASPNGGATVSAAWPWSRSCPSL